MSRNGTERADFRHGPLAPKKDATGPTRLPSSAYDHRLESAKVKQDRQIHPADDTLHDPLLARISALDALPVEDRLKWVQEQSATLMAAKTAARTPHASQSAEYARLLEGAHLAIIDAQLRCLTKLQTQLVASGKVRSV